jgi:hypothetical protein
MSRKKAKGAREDFMKSSDYRREMRSKAYRIVSKRGSVGRLCAGKIRETAGTPSRLPARPRRYRKLKRRKLSTAWQEGKECKSL